MRWNCFIVLLLVPSIDLSWVNLIYAKPDQDPLAGQPTVELWPDGAPGAVGEETTDRPTLTLFPVKDQQAVVPAIVICPGGGYRHLAVGHEGLDIARWFNQLGISAFVLKYRLAPRYGHPAPLDDVQRALRLVRMRAETWKVDPNHLGVIGFSAGGHLASSAATHFDDGEKKAEDPIERQSCRPDFAILCYPVISMMEPYMHRGSRNNLLGKQSDPKWEKWYSNEKQVLAKSPPTFLFHTNDDPVVSAENSVAYYLALRKMGVPAEMHIYQTGRHGVGLAAKDPILASWPDRCEDWLRLQGLLRPEK